MTGAEKAARARAGKARKAKERAREERRELKEQLRLAERTARTGSRRYLAMEDHSTDEALTLQRRVLGALAMTRYYKERLDA